MLKNYFKIALRNLSKQKLYSFINVFGLAIGMAFSILVILFVFDELRYDHFHENKEDIYRVYRQPTSSSSPIDLELATPLPTGQAMKDDFPEVEEFARLTPFGGFVIQKDGELIQQSGFAYGDPSVLEMFTFPTLYGDPSSALNNPSSIVITEEIAEKYFGSSNALGEILSIRLNNEFQNFEVTAVLKDIPQNSSIQFNLLFSTQTIFNNFERYASMTERWDASSTVTFVKLLEGTEIELVRAKLSGFMEKYQSAMFDQMREQGRIETGETPFIYQLQPLLDVHLNPDIPGSFTSPSDPRYSLILAAIATAVLLIACFNFMILAIGRSSKRIKEVGLRKVIGAHRSQLMLQFWGEALIITFLAFLAGFVLAEFSLPIFNELSGKELSMLSLFSNSKVVAGLIGIFLFTSLVAGSYPALFLANFRPIESLKQKINLRSSGRFTKGLIVTQFGLTIFLIASTFIMTEQLQFMQEKNLGFSGQQMVVIPTNGLDGQRVMEIYQNEFNSNPNVINVSGANVSFATGLWRRGYRYEGEIHQAAVFRVAPNYIETMEMNLVSGRNFDPLLASDSTQSIIVNQTFLENHNLNLSAVGQSFPIDWGWMVDPIIIGVVEDFNYQSLENEVAPVMIYMNPRDPILNLMVRIRPEQMQETIAEFENTWTSITNEVPFEYSFLDDDMNNLYAEQDRWSRIISYSSFLAILIACLGLFGLAGLVAVQRQKEIGIRKVLGATTSGITVMLSSGFAKLVLLALIISSPVAWYVMNNWLKDFAYRIEISAWIFILSGLIALGIALLTVSYQSVKAAVQDPVNNLRSE
ncbi:MAG: ABC transporter permease [Balneolaceae bacterium]|nr:ABC transporter permease [Balneolaceae bacterium]MBO6544776.1 ABC transporter permease [Balneolaceae bacterium]MBO6646172.1 ABC transporter permease [Balneolaceae bacterium]